MDEREFLSTSDPAALLEFLQPRLTERLRRQWIMACESDLQFVCPSAIEDFVNHQGFRASAELWAMALRAEETPAVMARRCDFLRDIAGPYREVYSLCGYGGCIRGFLEIDDPVRPCDRCNRILTPAVIDLARGIVRGREGRCLTCGGTGEHYVQPHHQGYGGWERCSQCHGTGKVPGEPEWQVECPDCYKGVVIDKKVGGLYPRCPRCHGTGRVSGGPDDWEAMSILADALEEAGCTCEEILMHLRGLVKHIVTDPSQMSVRALEYGCTEEEVWLPGPGHTRGCWAITLLAGKSVWEGGS